MIEYCSCCQISEISSLEHLENWVLVSKRETCIAKKHLFDKRMVSSLLKVVKLEPYIGSAANFG